MCTQQSLKNRGTVNRLHLSGHLRISTDTIKVPCLRVTPGKQCQHTDTLFKDQDPQKPYPVGLLPTYIVSGPYMGAGV